MVQSEFCLLLVEDEPTHAELVRRAMFRGMKDWSLIVVEDLAGAFSWVESGQPDLVLVDLKLPDGSGLDLLNRKEYARTHPIIILTSQGGEQDAVDALKMGALDYVVKTPEFYRDLPRMISRWMREWNDIVMRRRAEQALSEREQLLGNIINTTIDGYLLLNSEGKILEVNHAFCNTVGYTRDELLEMTVHDLEVMETPDETRQHMQGVFSNGADFFETHHRRKDGTLRLLEVSTTSLHADRLVCFIRDITERKRIEDELRTSEEKFRLTFDLSPIGAVMADLDLRFQRCNNAFCEFLGYSENELMGRTFLEFTHPDDLHIGINELKAIAAGTLEKAKLEKRYIHKNGSVVWGEVNISMVPGTANTPGYYLSLIINIQARKEAGELVRERDERLQSIFRAAPIGIGLNVNRVIQDVNQTLLDMLGYQREELIGRNARILYPTDEDYDYVGVEKYRQIKLHGKGTVVTRWIRKDGEIRDILLSSAPINPADLMLGVTFSALDITERKKMDDDLRKSEERFRNLVDNIPEAVIVYQNKRVVYINPATTLLSGFTLEDFQERDILSVVHPDALEMVHQSLKAMIPGETTPALEIPIIKKNGEFAFFETLGIPIEVNGKPSLLILARDITERRKDQEQLKLSKAKLEEAEKLARLGSYEIDLRANTLTWSEEMFTIFGLDVGRAPTIEMGLIFIHPDDRQRFNEKYDQFLKEGKAFDIVYCITRLDGELRHVHNLARIEFDEGGSAVRVFGTIQDITERKLTEDALEESRQQMRDRLHQLMALHDIDVAITSHREITPVMDAVLHYLEEMPEIGAVAVFLTNWNTDQLTCVARTGMDADSATDLINWLEGDAYLAENSGQPVMLLSRTGQNGIATGAPVGQGMVSVAILPLLMHEIRIGYMVIGSPFGNLFDNNWVDFFHSLAMQIAMALENAHLFAQMEEKNRELTAAYEATLEGWSRTLEMRDKETKGHSDRVTRVSILLAEHMGLNNEQLRDLRRGVLLHDIGKLAIPDSILFKPGPLTEEEWIVMRQHPEYAQQFLSGIPNFERTIDIPYCHHEKWDGSGYPRGLKGEEIPLEARIFAIVDVWDALTSDRPYRPAWSEERTRNYLLQQSCQHFDPQVVEAFIHLLDQGFISKMS